MERAFRVVIVVAGLTIAGFGLSAASSVVVPVLLALCLALAVQPLLNQLEKRRAPRFLSVSCAMLAVLLGIALFFATLVFGASQLLSELPTYEKAARELQADTTSWFASRGLTTVAVAVGSLRISSLVLDGVVLWMPELPELLGNGVFVLILTLFMLLEQHTFNKKMKVRLAGFAASNARIFEDVQHYLGVKTLVSAATGLTAGLWCMIWQVPNAPLWGVLAFVLNYIPVVGSFAAAAPPTLLAFLLGDTSTVVGVVSGYAAINIIVGNIIEPRWLGRACGLSPLVVLMSMVLWGALLGPVGALLSVPLTSAMRVALSQFADFKWLGYLMDHESVPQSRPSSAAFDRSSRTSLTEPQPVSREPA